MTQTQVKLAEATTLHPLDDLTLEEINLARKIILETHPTAVIYFREIYLAEPPKRELQLYLDEEHLGNATINTPRPSRRAKCQFDVIGPSRVPEFHEAFADLKLECLQEEEMVDKRHHASLTM